MKYTVQAVLLNDKLEVLGVSRKDDHNDFGLPGGKVDPEDWCNEAAMQRELREETGLDCNMNTAIVVFQMHKHGYMSICYYIKDWEGEINYKEPHVVKWTPFQTILEGSFGRYNYLVTESLKDMGVKFKLMPDAKDEYYFEFFESEYDDDPPHFYIESKTYWDKHKESKFELDDDEEDDIDCICSNNEIGLPEACEGVYELQAKVDGKFETIFEKKEIERIMIGAGFKKNKGFTDYVNKL